ncbi:hypothetical protein SSX86_010929 [Deinandra increscens subsp. villosa]|uniref:ATP-dependent DNA helicase n=1 Tax=Deinandra increscens subsp. villosa TaxID=3103831 RepID=A0AAP0H3N9_9ASTR
MSKDIYRSINSYPDPVDGSPYIRNPVQPSFFMEFSTAIPDSSVRTVVGSALRLPFSTTTCTSANVASSSGTSNTGAGTSAPAATKHEVDEVKNFVDGRFVCPHEAAWRILKFPIHHRLPAVQVLSVHLDGQQNVTFTSASALDDVVNSPSAKRTTLTEWLRNNTRDPSGTVYQTFRAACEVLGLIGDDTEWTLAFMEAAAWGTSAELRTLFANMLLFCEVSNPTNLWNEHWRAMTDDIVLEVSRQTNVDPKNIPDFPLQQRLLYELEKILNSSATYSSLEKFGLPLPQGEYVEMLCNRLLMEEKCYDRAHLAAEHQRLRSAMHPRQLEIYEMVMHGYNTKSQLLLFIYGHGGTGKTYLWNTIISAIRSAGDIVLAVAASGIASLLLPAGRTVHSRFRIPINISPEAMCNVSKKTNLAQLLIETSLIIWDEAPMSDRECFECLDRTLRDILDNPNVPFGGEVTEASVPDSKAIQVPTEFLIQHADDALLKLIDFIYDTDSLQAPSAQSLAQKAIVCPKNKTAAEINSLVLQMTPGVVSSYLSTDSVEPHAGDNGGTEVLYPDEYLNGLTFQGLPPHCIELKVDTPVILLRNLNQNGGLCNGTRLIITQLLPRVIEARIMTGTCIGKRVYIPRITFLHDDKELPFLFRRRQYPLKVCYAMTINKSQGQSLQKIGVYLPEHVFGHGQLYVACSRATSPQSLKILIVPQEGYSSNTTKNIVYSDLLEEIDQLSMAQERKVADIRPNSQPAPIKVRVLHKWKPYHTRETMTYLLIDNYADAIQAMFHQDEEVHLDAKVELMKTYTLSGYKCTVAPTFNKVALHTESLEVDRHLVVEPLADDETFPKMVEDLEHVETGNNNSVLRLKVSEQGNTVVVALWKEIHTKLDLGAITDADHHVIVAFTALKVVAYQRGPQLQSSAGTKVEIEPHITVARDMADWFRDHGVGEPENRLAVPQVRFLEKTSEKDRATIGHLMQQDRSTLKEGVYTVEATLASFTEGRGWFFVTCTECKAMVYDNNMTYSCEKHKQQHLRYSYSVNCNIQDDTDAANVTVFDRGMLAMTGIRCYNMLGDGAVTDHKVLPPLIEAQKGAKWIFQVKNGERFGGGSLKFTVNGVFKTNESTPPSLTAAGPSGKDKLCITDGRTSKARKELFPAESAITVTEGGSSSSQKGLVVEEDFAGSDLCLTSETESGSEHPVGTAEQEYSSPKRKPLLEEDHSNPLLLHRLEAQPIKYFITV